MKSKHKFSTRERWALAIAPTAIIIGVYLFGFAGDLSAGLEKEKKRAAAAMAPLPPQGPPPALAKAKAAFDEVTHAIADRQAGIAQLETWIAALPKNAAAITDDPDRAREIEQVEAIFARNGITPVVSEAAGEGDAAEQALLAVLSTKLEGADAGDVKQSQRVWHCIFDDSTPHFQKALAEVAREVPSVVPLTLNLVYNPDNNGQSRLLELWLLY